MDKAFDLVSGFLGRVCDIGVKLIAVGVVLQVLFGAAVPFLGIDVVAGVIKLVTALGSQGLVGLVAVAVLYWAYNKKQTLVYGKTKPLLEVAFYLNSKIVSYPDCVTRYPSDIKSALTYSTCP